MADDPNKKRFKALRQKLVFAVLSMLGALALAFLTSTYTLGCAVEESTLIISSILCFGVASLGGLDEESSSNDGTTPPELLDKYIFNTLYCFGMYFAMVAAF
jgi:hypothetical protein